MGKLPARFLKWLERGEVCIYTMGRVGTMSTVSAFNDAGIHPISVHNLVVPGEFYSSSVPHTKMIEHIRSNGIPVMSLVRDPIARNLSAYYLHRDRYYNKTWGHKNSFLSNYPHHYVTSWVDEELTITTGVDVYRFPFPKLHGYRVYKTPWSRLLVIRTDVLSEPSAYAPSMSAQAIEEWIGVPNIAVPKTSKLESVAEAYKEFLEEVIPLPAQFVRNMYNNRFSKHFFGERKLSKFIKKWSE